MMNSTDLKMIEKILDALGFRVNVSFAFEESQVVVTKKDPWEGVEFVMDAWGFIFKIDKKEGERFYDCNGKWESISRCSPSTEEAYVEQLKKEAFERFGLIKVGDEFNAEWNIVKSNTIAKEYDPDKWTYDSTNDRLFLAKIGDGGAIIYQKGKWAERVKDRITVKYHKPASNNDAYYFGFKISNLTFDREKAGKYLAQQLENYLNDESKSV
jgi:hypothetical protein